MTKSTIRVLLVVTCTFASSIAGAAGVNCPELTASAGNNGPVCANSPVGLTGSSNQIGASYYWSGPHTWFSSQQNPTAPGPGTYFLTVRNADGCETSASTTVDTITPPMAALSGSATQACGGEIVTVSVNDPSLYSTYEWDVSSATILSGQGTPSIQIQVDNYNNTTVAWFRGMHTGIGCKTPTASYIVDVDPRYVAVLDAPTAACPGSMVTASVPHYVSAAYAWSVTHATNVHDVLDQITFIPDGTGDVVLTATIYNNWATCPSSDTAVISVGGPTAHVDAELAICPGQSTAIPVTLGGAPPFSITWSDGLVQSGIPTTQTTRAITPTETTVYSIISVSDSACLGTASGSAMVLVQDEPEILTDPQNVAILRGQKATLSVEAAGTDLTYDWYEGHAGNRSHLVASGASSKFETPALQHTTRYWVEVISGCGATESSTAMVSVSGRQRSARH